MVVGVKAIVVAMVGLPKAVAVQAAEMAVKVTGTVLAWPCHLCKGRLPHILACEHHRTSPMSYTKHSHSTGDLLGSPRQTRIGYKWRFRH